GSTCNDNNACTSGETCQSGSCGRPTSTVTCTALDQCHVAGTCSTAKHTCELPNNGHRISCHEHNTCTSGETCQSDSIRCPPSTVTCTALVQCHVARTPHTTTRFPYTPLFRSGSTCNDNNACTSGETCQSGSCGRPTSTVTCTALDQCHVAGTC